MFIKLKTETNNLSDLDLPADEQKKLTEDRRANAMKRYTDDKASYSKLNGDKPLIECFQNDTEDAEEENATADKAKADKAKADKAAADKAKAAKTKSNPTDPIVEKEVDSYIQIINDCMVSDNVVAALNKQTMIESTLGFHTKYINRLKDLAKKEGRTKEGFRNPEPVVEGFQTLTRSKFLALKLLKSLKPMLDMVEKHYDLQAKLASQKDEVKKIQQIFSL
jgi:hypothetical protein